MSKSFAQWLEDYSIGSLIISGHDFRILSNKKLSADSNPYGIENAEVTLQNFSTSAVFRFQYIRNHIRVTIEDGYETNRTSTLTGYNIVEIKVGETFTFHDSGQQTWIQNIDSNSRYEHRYRTTINLVAFIEDTEAKDPDIEEPGKGCSITIGLMVIAFIMGVMQWVL